MKSEELQELLLNKSEAFPKNRIPEALHLFRVDAFSGECELLPLFFIFLKNIPLDKSFFSINDLHYINQMYIQTGLNKGLITNENLASMYLKNIEYFSSLNAYLEEIKYINMVLDLENIPEIYYMLAISYLVYLVNDNSAKDYAKPFIDRYISFFDYANLDSETYFYMRMKLLAAYILLDMPKEFSEEKKLFERALPSQSNLYNICISKLLILAGDTLLNDISPSSIQMEEFKNICIELAQKNIRITAHISDILIPFISKLRNQFSDEMLTYALLGLVPLTISDSDKIAIYEYLFGRLRVDKEKYKSAYEDYFFILRRYYQDVSAFSIKEAIAEMRFKKSQKLHKLDKLSLEIESLSEIYISMHLLKLNEDKILPLKSNDFIESFRDASASIQTQLNQVSNEMAKEKYLEEYKKFMDISTINERMQQEATITFEFENVLDEICNARFISSERNLDGSLKEVIFAVEVLQNKRHNIIEDDVTSDTDWLTGFRTKKAAEEIIRTYIEQKKYGMYCVIDIDDFKNINDTHGRITGDTVIKEISKVLSQAFNENDILYRLGGDEFAVFAPDITDIKSAEKLIQKMYALVSEISIPKLEDQTLSLSIGVTFYIEGDIVDLEAIFGRADAGTYRSKMVKGNSCTFID